MSTKPAPSTLPRLTVKELKLWRSEQLTRQAGRCRLCQLPLSLASACADHDHKTGRLRGLLHRPCNSVLGSVENGAKRYGMPPHMLRAFAHGVGRYLGLPQKPVIYPLHRTPEEKRVLRNKRAAATRARKKS